MEPAQAIIARQHRLWSEKPEVRLLYNDWYQRMLALKSPSRKPLLELGAGNGSLKEMEPDVVATDIVWSPWLNAVSDAHDLPFKAGSMGNIIMLDVLHHLASPSRFFEEAARALEAGGRLLMVEPWLSPISKFIYALFHQEEIRCNIHPLQNGKLREKEPFDGNGAIPTLIFWKHAEEFKNRFPMFRILHRECLAMIAYPLSGGFKKWSLLPVNMVKPLLAFERKNQWLEKWMAFRCLVVLEKN